MVLPPHAFLVIGKSVVAPVVSTVVQQLLQLEDEKVRLLRAIDGKVDALMAGPYKEGLHHLHAVETGDPGRRDMELEFARNKFIEAASDNDKVDPLTATWAAIHAGAICRIQGDHTQVIYWIDNALTYARDATERRCAQANDTVNLRKGRIKITSHKQPWTRMVVQSGGAAGAMLLGAGALVAPVGAIAGIGAAAGIHYYRKHRLMQVVGPVNELCVLVNNLTTIRNSLSDQVGVIGG